jgi:hypothetical protein
MKFLLWMIVPICKTCIHYLPSPDGSFDSSVAKCKKIGTIDVVTGDIEYSSARSVRDHACSKEGILYSPEPRLFLKELNHNVKKNRVLIAYTGYMILYMSTIIYLGQK